MLDYKLLEALAAVISAGTFDAAARRLNLTQSAVSQRVKQFEIQVGQPLIHRGPPPAPTELGKRLIAHYQQVHALEQQLAPELGRAEPSVRMRVTIALNNDSLYYWFLDAIMPVLKKRRFVLDLLVDDEGRTDEWLRTGQAYAAISSVAQAPHGCSSTPLGGLRYLCMATKKFQQAYFRKGVDRAALRQAPFVMFDRQDTLHDEFLWKYFRLRDAECPRFSIPSPKGFLQIIAAGCAYALMPEIEMLPYIRRRRLVELTPGMTMHRPLYWHSWFVQPPLEREIADTVCRAAGKMLVDSH